MSDSTITLPGLDRLIAVLKRHGIGVDPHPHNPDAPLVGESILGEPFDPILAAMYARLDGGRFGELSIFCTRLPNNENWLLSSNIAARDRAEERIQRLFRFATFSGFAYDLATVPSLAAGNGNQPVVYVSDYDEKPILPIASSVDRAFDLYARYCEARIVRYGCLEGQPDIEFEFPYTLTNDIALDRDLTRMIEEGRFDHLVLMDMRITRDMTTREWLQTIVSSAKSSSA